MRFSDVTLDGLMKEFEKISKANEDGESNYVLPQDLLDQPAAEADVPYYSEILKSTASERSKLYGVVADSKILDEAHPKGSAKLEGLSGDEITVEDLQDMKAQFEKVVNSTVRAKTAGLGIRLKKLAKSLLAAGHTQLAAQVNQQFRKLAEEVNFSDEDALVTDVPKAEHDQLEVEMGTPTVTNVPKSKTDMAGLKNISDIINIFEPRLMDLIGDKYYTGTRRDSWKYLEQDLKKYFGLYPSNAQNLPAGAKTYSNWNQLAQLVNAGINEWEDDMRNLEIGGAEHDLQRKLKDGEFANIGDIRRFIQTPGQGAMKTPERKPTAPQELPLSANPSRSPPRI